jgi:hypothetical protein
MLLTAALAIRQLMPLSHPRCRRPGDAELENELRPHDRFSGWPALGWNTFVTQLGLRGYLIQIISPPLHHFLAIL